MSVTVVEPVGLPWASKSVTVTPLMPVSVESKRPLLSAS